VEVYGELLRDDHNADQRDLVGEPDHESAWTLGARRAWRRGTDVWGISAERTNGRITHLARVRGQAAMYVHTNIQEGHTQRGQMLGSTAAFGGQGLSVALSKAGAAHSRDVTYEVRTLGQSGEGGNLGSRPTGIHSIRLDELVARWRALLTADLQLGYGGAPSFQLLVSVARWF
jgi:hypothetical protein